MPTFENDFMLSCDQSKVVQVYLLIGDIFRDHYFVLFSQESFKNLLRKQKKSCFIY